MPQFPSSGSNPIAIPPYTVFAGPQGSSGGSGSISSPFKYAYDAVLDVVAHGGGTVNLNSSTRIGGPVADQGLWLRNDGVDVPGFIDIEGAPLVINGNGNQSGSFVFQRPGASTLLGGSDVDYKKPWLWIVGSEVPMSLNYLQSLDPNVPFQGLLSPVRLGWDYVRKTDFSLEQLTVSSAARASGSCRTT